MRINISFEMQRKSSLGYAYPRIQSYNKFILNLMIWLVASILTYSNTFAYYNLYGECVKGYELTDNPIDAIVLSPLNRTCQARCQKECSAFSRKVYENDNDTEPGGVELNEDIISNCMTVCQNGEIFKSKYFEAAGNKDGKPQIELRPEAKIGVACTGTKEEIANNTVRTRFTVKKDDKMKISLTGLTADSSKIYLCGKKSLVLTPIFPNIDAANFDITKSNWDDDTNKQQAWSNKMEHQCFADMSDADFNALTNKKIWINRTGNTACDWHARNPNYINTGVYVANGDELNITWYGEYAYKRNGTDLATRKLLIDCLRSNSVTDTAKANCKNIFLNSSAISIKDPMQTSFSFTAGTSMRYVIQGERARPDNAPIGVFNTNPPQDSYTTFNLTGKVTDEGLKSEFNKGVRGCDDQKQESFSKPECIKLTQYGKSKYSFSGILQEFSDKRTPLAIRHHDEIPFSGKDPTSYMNLYKINHFGGYNVEVKWGGCPFNDGSRIQYAVFKEDKEEDSMYERIPKIPETDWHDLPLDVLKPEGVLTLSDINIEGKLFLRIKTIPAGAGASKEVKDLYENPANYHGQYYITVEKSDETNAMVKDGPILKIVKIVTNTIFGKNRKIGEVTNSGVVYKIYDSVASNSKLANIVRAALVLYMLFFGVGFGIGVIRANQQELIHRLIKFGFVLAVISPTSWSFFGGHLVPLCIDGTTEIIANIMAGSYSLENAGLTEAEILKNPYLIFKTFDAPLKIMLSAAVWKKIVALLFNGLIGIAMTAVLVIGIFIYLVNILKVLVVYLTSIIVLSLLIIITPIVLPFMLFSLTKTIFDNWGKQIISFALQPILCFAAISLFNFLLIMLLKIILNFTACPTCALYVDLSPIYEACWIPAYYPVYSIHMPGQASAGFGVLFSVVSTSLAFLIIVHGSYMFTTYMSLIASTIVTGSPIRTATVMGAVDKAQSTTVGTLKAVTFNVSNYAMSAISRDSPGEDAQSSDSSGGDGGSGDNEAKKEDGAESKRAGADAPASKDSGNAGN